VQAGEADLILNILDAANLEPNLYLTTPNDIYLRRPAR
jgi:Fe2+ transport system protein B